jgi:hypothetical protein
MYRSPYLIIFVCLYLLMLGCDSEKKTPNEELRKEVIDIHDEVMPLMGNIKSLKTKVLEKSDLISQSDSADLERIRELDQLAAELDNAFEGMFVWMRQFKSDYEGMSSDEVKKYLLEQKEKVEKVNVDIKNAIASATIELEEK